jgi:hypothetical protein
MTARTRSPRPPFSIADCLRHADETLANPQRWPYVRRIEPVGELVARFVVPLAYCLTSNQRMRGGIKQRYLEADLKRRCYEFMRMQNGGRNAERPLDGRPQLICIRFSSRLIDATSDWTKLPADRLLIGKHGLGFLVDDSPRYLDIGVSQEFASPGRGFGLMSLFRGAE